MNRTPVCSSNTCFMGHYRASRRLEDNATDRQIQIRNKDGAQYGQSPLMKLRSIL